MTTPDPLVGSMVATAARSEVRLTERDDREIAGLDQRQRLLGHAEELPALRPLADARAHHGLVRNKQFVCVHDAVAR